MNKDPSYTDVHTEENIECVLCGGLWPDTCMDGRFPVHIKCIPKTVQTVQGIIGDENDPSNLPNPF